MANSPRLTALSRAWSSAEKGCRHARATLLRAVVNPTQGVEIALVEPLGDFSPAIQIGDAVAEGTPLQIVCRPAFFGSVSAQVVDLVGGGLDAENVSYLAGKPGRDFTRGVKAFPRNRIRSVLE